MRFIYIDSQGKEVSIPTVDALALRIELGAITVATRLYDEASDRWAPAGEHEIFRSLLREREEKSGAFVAPPPPPMAPPPPVAPSARPPRGPNPFDGLEGHGAPAEPPAAPASSKPGKDDALGGLDFDLTLSPPAAASSFDAADAEFGLPESGSELRAPGGEAERSPAPAAGGKKRDESPDFSGFGGLLSDDDDGGDDEPAAPPAARPAASDPGFALEGVFASSYGGMPTEGGSAVTEGAMDLERPLSEQGPGGDAEWSPRDRMKVETAEEEAAAAESAARRARAQDQAGRADRPARARSAPASEPAVRSPLPALLAATVILAVVGGGGWLAWTRMQDGPPPDAEPAQAVEPSFPLPAIASELEPRMRELADSAKRDWLAALRTTLPAERALPPEPDPEWLAGSYLADAGRFGGVERYWRSLGDYVDDLEAREADLFAGFYRTRLDSAGVEAADAQSMLERARAGFLAGQAERRPAYREVREVVSHSLGLHEFLVANEARIQHEPAAGGASRDPVLEAVPDTPELGRDMWNRVDSITGSLDSLGALDDKVTTTRLLDLLGARLEAVRIR